MIDDKKFANDVAKIIEIYQGKGILNFEITTTQQCNMRCTYCFEQDFLEAKMQPTKNTEMYIKRIYELLDDEWFNDNFSGINIDFWGGEPTLNKKLINRVVNEFIDDERIQYHLYTNGFEITYLKELWLKFKEKDALNRFDFQFSYDGKVVTDAHRLDINKVAATDTILKNAREMYDMGANMHFKSTLPIPHFKNLPKIWDEFETLYYEFSDEDRQKFRYHPTIDHYNTYTDLQVDEFKESMIELAKREIEFYKKNGKYLFSWFSGEKPICNAGAAMISFDIKGDGHFCHGCMYIDDDKRQETITASIFDEDFLDKFKSINKQFRDYININDTEKECRECEATQCMRCNALKWALSEDNNVISGWYDYETQPHICDYFKIFGNIDRALKKIINEMEEK